MLIDVALQPYCEGCPMMKLETHNVYYNADLIVTHFCEHRTVCENAIYQNKKFWEKKQEEMPKNTDQCGRRTIL